MMAHPRRVAFPVIFPEGVLLSRLVVGAGVEVTEVITNVERLIVHAEVYGNVLVVNTDVYPTLIVVRLSV